MKKDKYFFECTNCGKTYPAENFIYLCPKCEKENVPNQPPKGVLKILYNYKKVKTRYKRDKLFDKLKAKEYRFLLPIKFENSLSFLKIGKTPLYDVSNLPFMQNQNFSLFLKDDSQNPTFSFKDRASDLVCAFAKENGIKKIVTASTGNAGSSLAGICAAENLEAIVFAPKSAPKAKLTQILMYAAKLITVDGNYDKAFDLSIEATKKHGWFNRNTAYNPLTIEGKKIVSFEIFQQLNQQIPENIFVPVGDGCIISGVYKGFEDLLKLGIIQKIPTIIAVQSAKSDNLIRNLKNNKFTSNKSETIADSIAVDIPRNFWMTKQFIEKYDGKTVLVTDDEILKASKQLSENSGLFTEPAAATAFAGFQKFQQSRHVAENSKNIVLLTGSGLKDLASVQNIIEVPQPIKKLEEIKL
ncbi:MAG: threonine synthase [Candidatus Cloacimonetes bacterium]|jgi:threonine synthase|nr:threonine synthase [Candidatus Cloacimonadota bacterium]MBT6994771.1 threonine synthase [Candidatus Cloacimonadota bacterium]MBT7469672.1 threonine synthase [Candidatus Cloacimonadota bacterium]